MKWDLINSGAESGKFNMDFDLYLSELCNNDQAFFRLYRWNPYAISLGANQNFEEINIEKANRDRIDVVKRPTGGRAILHAEELTYSIILPIEFELTAKDIYKKVSLTLAEALKKYDERLKEIELENIQPNFPQLLIQPSGSLCFASTAKSEVKFRGKKIIGSAQRKMNKVILQHGSILCGNFHTQLINYLRDVSSNEQTEKLLRDNTIEIENIINEKVDYEKLSELLITTFEKEWGINFSTDKSELLTTFQTIDHSITELN